MNVRCTAQSATWDRSVLTLGLSGSDVEEGTDARGRQWIAGVLDGVAVKLYYTTVSDLDACWNDARREGSGVDSDD